MMKPSFLGLVAALAMAAPPELHAAGQPAPGGAARPSAIERAHARALDSFRRARFPEAYGRLVALANVGHVPSARVALWMCEQGPAVFGSDWDCTPEEIDDWRALSLSVVGAAGRSR